MKRQTIKEATRYKVEWCCEVAPNLASGLFSGTDMQDAISAMHNAQAMYLKYVSGPRYRGTGEMFAEITDIGTLRITMRWAGTKNHGHMLGRRDRAFHAKGEVPKPMLIGTVEPLLPAKEAVAKAMKEHPEMFVPEEVIAAIPASEDGVAKFHAGPIPPDEPEEPAAEEPRVTATVTEVQPATPDSGPGITVNVEPAPASEDEETDAEAVGRNAREVSESRVSAKEAWMKSEAKAIADATPTTPHATGLEMSPPEVVWPKTVKGLRRLARVMKVDVKDIKGEGSKKRIIARLEAASGSQSETPAPEAP